MIRGSHSPYHYTRNHAIQLYLSVPQSLDRPSASINGSRFLIIEPGYQSISAMVDDTRGEKRERVMNPVAAGPYHRS